MAEEHPSLKALNAAISEPENFKKFAANPGEFAKGYGVTISPDISTHLATKLSGVSSLAEYGSDDGGGDFTAAAVAYGALAVTDTKIAAVAI